MERYKVVINSHVQKYLDKLPDKLANKLESAMVKLEANPRPHGCEKMSVKDAYRIRVGEYRIIYEIHDKVLVVRVIDAGHQREVYKN